MVALGWVVMLEVMLEVELLQIVHRDGNTSI